MASDLCASPLNYSNSSVCSVDVFEQELVDFKRLIFSVSMQVSLLAVGIVIWRVMRACGTWDLVDEKKGSLDLLFPRTVRTTDGRGAMSTVGFQRGMTESTVMRNYLRFLRESRNMFWCLAVMSLATRMLLAASSVHTDRGGHVHGWRRLFTFSATQCLTPTRLTLLLMDAVLRGLVALKFVERLQERLPSWQEKKKVSGVSDADVDKMQRTLWMSELPVWDRLTWQFFQLEQKDIEDVEKELGEAISKHIMENAAHRRGNNDEDRPLFEVKLSLVMDDWHNKLVEFRSAKERWEAFKWRGQVEPTNLFAWASGLYAELQSYLYKIKVERLESELARIKEAKRKMAGSAFITFADPRDRKVFLEDNRPGIFTLQSYNTHFTFGKPPFTSSSLTCARAPHPQDVAWMNLHVSTRQQLLRFWSSSFLLFLLMFVLICFIFGSKYFTMLMTILDKQYQDELLQPVSDFFSKLNYKKAVKILRNQSVCKQLPSVLLCILNSLVLPFFIQAISMYVQPHRNSQVEVIQLHLNAGFLILNCLVFPIFLGLYSARQVFEEAGKIGAGTVLDQLVLSLETDKPGVFALRYIMACTCITSTNSLLQLPQLISRWYCRQTARTARESVDAEEPWVFAWGYWYAWTVSIFTIGIVLGGLVPCASIFAAFFFTVQHAVDRYNLTHRVYAHGPDIEIENLLVVRVLHYMRCVIAVWWCLGGCISLKEFQRLKCSGQKWDSFIEEQHFLVACWAVVVLSVALGCFSLYTQQKALHDNQFDDDLQHSNRGLSHISGIDGCTAAMSSVRCDDFFMEEHTEAPHELAVIFESDEETFFARRTTPDSKLTWDSHIAVIHPLEVENDWL